MDLKIFYFLCGAILLYDVTIANDADESQSVKRDGAKKINYAENTPFFDEETMQQFIRTKLAYVPLPVDTLKEILYLTYNSHKMKIRVSGQVPFDVFSSRLKGLFDENELWVVSTTNSEIPIAEYRRSLQMILSKSDETKLHNALGGAAKIRINGLEKNGTTGHHLQNEATVVIPNLFRSNYTIISPVLDFYFPELANVSVVKNGVEIVRYTEFKRLHDGVLEPVVLERMPDIPIDGGKISFTNLRHMLAGLNHDEKLILSRLRKNSTLAEKALPLNYWMTVLDTMNTNVDEYLKMSVNGTVSHENLPWIGCCKAMNNSASTVDVKPGLETNPQLDMNLNISTTGNLTVDENVSTVELSKATSSMPNAGNMSVVIPGIAANATSVHVSKLWLPWSKLNSSASLNDTDGQRNFTVCVIHFQVNNMTKNITFYPLQPCPVLQYIIPAPGGIVEVNSDIKVADQSNATSPPSKLRKRSNFIDSSSSRVKSEIRNYVDDVIKGSRKRAMKANKKIKNINNSDVLVTSRYHGKVNHRYEFSDTGKNLNRNDWPLV